MLVLEFLIVFPGLGWRKKKISIPLQDQKCVSDKKYLKIIKQYIMKHTEIYECLTLNLYETHI